MKTMLIMVALVSSISAPAAQDRDLDAVMRVVQKESVSVSPQAGKVVAKEATLLRLSIRDEDGEALTLSLPLSWLEWMLAWDEEVSLEDIGSKSRASLQEVMKRVRALGPSELLEVRDGGETIRIWLE